SDEDDYVPSQVQEDYILADWGSQKHCPRDTRTLELAKTSQKLRLLYSTGGPLDSQTTDSQHIEELITRGHVATSSSLDWEVKRSYYKRRRLAMMGKGRKFKVKCEGCPQYQRNLLLLQKKVQDLESALNSTRQMVSSLAAYIGPHEPQPESPGPGNAITNPWPTTFDLTPQDSPLDTEHDAQYDSDYEARKVQIMTDDGRIWMMRDEQSQLEVSPPRPRPQRVRTSNTYRAPLDRIRESHNGDQVEYYVSQTQL
ncbi:hypothetical protein BC629DRAFT_1539289, partial [Irpex lacteus]